MDKYENFALTVLVAFGALIIGSLMAIGIVWHDKPTFLFALGAAVVVWGSAFAVIFEKPGLYGGLLVLTVLLVAASITALVI
ncbi:MAG: hypothetical protein ACRECW_07115 [Phyllobacterium sp.]